MTEMADVFAPGVLILEELDARGWTKSDLAEIMDRPPNLITEIIKGNTAITPKTAQGLGDALGTSAQFWLNLDSSYRLHKYRDSQNGTSAVARKSALYVKAPIKDMLKRGWLTQTDSIDVLERQVMDFFELPSIDDEPQLRSVARKSTAYTEATVPQRAWLQRSLNLARCVSAVRFTPKRFARGLDNLKALMHEPEEIRHVPRVLSESGVRFVVVEPLPRTKIDGACLWLDSYSPVVALSMRYDRIDCFWYTLMHELGHVFHKHGLSLDSQLVGADANRSSDRPACEEIADCFAVEGLIPPSEIEGFIARVKPLFSKKRVAGFASRINVHPGIVIGQLQFRSEVDYSHSREFLVKVRDLLTESALTDGWGYTPSI